MDELAYLPAARLAGMIRRRELSPVELVEACLDRIERRNPAVNAFVTVCGDEARAEARRAEREVMSGAPLPPLHGLPLAVKDLDPVAGIRTTQASFAFENEVPKADGASIARLRQAGAIVVGKTNTPEFGHKAITDNFLFGPTSSPFDLSANAGGSSGGSAAAVAEGLVPIAQGSDAGGSLRVPGSLCGVFAMMGTFGRVPTVVRPNAFGLLNPMVCYGPLTRTVEDGALMLQVMAGPHPRDPYSLPASPERYTDALNRPLTGVRIAYSPDLGGFPVEADVAAVVRESLRALVDDGATVVEVDIKLPRPHQEFTALWRRMQAVRQVEFITRMSRAGVDVLAHRERIAPTYLELLEMGARPSAVEYRLEDLLRTELLDTLQDVFDEYDLVVSPVTSVARIPNAPDRTTVGPSEVAGQSVNPLVGWCLTGLYNFTGSPAATVPAGFTPAGLPVGLQIGAARFDEPSVIAACAAVERHRPWQHGYAALEGRRAGEGLGVR
ncbi:amidase [Kitasatospora phosalacinea]|uniref:amidase n=1 Tax=Kitasatospora phosalacinea TaxID=2065 RepID=UPI00365155B3